MIVERIELKKAYRALGSLLIDVRKYVEAAIQLPKNTESAHRYAEECMVEHKKYSTAMAALSETLKQKGELFKTSVNEAISSNPQNHEKIETTVEEILSQIPYSTILTEVTHLNCALELKEDALGQVLGDIKPNLPFHHSNYQDNKGEILVSNQEIDDNTVYSPYMTTDGAEIEHHLSAPPPNITNVGGERFGNQQSGTSRKQKLENNNSLDNNGQFVLTHRNEKSIDEKQWSTHDLIKVLTTITINGQNNAKNEIQFPEIKIPQFNGSQDSFDEFWAILNQIV
uniref:TPR_REGION domain-containing protein n=1 Tax=Heterorhabditis bacteriophora TaxID=37862 RepID=A0A1I7W806_HETBA